MTYEERALLYEEERIDIEFAVVKSLLHGLREKGKVGTAEYVKEAADHLQRAKFLLQSARKATGIDMYEQIKMDLFDDD